MGTTESRRQGNVAAIKANGPAKCGAVLGAILAGLEVEIRPDSNLVLGIAAGQRERMEILGL